MEHFAGFLLLLIGLPLAISIGSSFGKGVGGEINAISMGLYMKEAEQLRKKYDPWGRVTCHNPHYVEYVKEDIELDKKYGFTSKRTVEDAERAHQTVVDNWVRAGGKMDSAGYLIDDYGRRAS